MENFFLFSAEGDEKSSKKNEKVKSNNSHKYMYVFRKIFERYEV